MKKQKIVELYNEKIKRFKHHSYLYFEKSSPKLSDASFDALKKEILDLEKKHKFLNSKDSPSHTLGFKPSKNFEKIRHKVPMLSLANAFDKEDLINFEKKIINYLNEKENFEIQYSAEPKIDGISASLIYIKGKFTRGLSRGDAKKEKTLQKI